MPSLKKLVGQTAIYGLSSIIGRFLNYLLVPLYTYKIAAESGGYGVVTNVYAYTALLLVMLTFGMETTFFYFANREEVDAKKAFATAANAVGLVSLLFWLRLFVGAVMEKIRNKAVFVLQLVMGIILLAMIVTNFVQMVTRYFISVTVVWVEDFSVLGLYWLFSLGVPMAWLMGAHMEMNILEKVMSKTFKRVIQYLTQGAGVAIGVLFITSTW